MTKRVKWSVTAAIVLMIAGMIAYPQIKSRMKASKDAAEVVPPAGSQVRKQVLNINAEVLEISVPYRQDHCNRQYDPG